jgi:hypothetical protein
MVQLAAFIAYQAIKEFGVMVTCYPGSSTTREPR